MTNKRFGSLVLIAVFVSAGLGVVFGLKNFASPPPLAIVQLAPVSKPLPEFELENHRGETMDVNAFRGNWSLVFFGFTSCPDFCPMELQKLAKVLVLNENRHPLQVVFVSVDPERDKLDKLAEYVGFFSPEIIGASGSNGELAKFALFFGAAYERFMIIEDKLVTIPAGVDMPMNAGSEYQVNHSVRVFLVSPAGEYKGNFAPPYEAENLFSDMQQLIGW